MCLGYSCVSHPWLHFKITWELLKVYQHWSPTPKYSDLIGLAAELAQAQRAPFTEKIFFPRVPQPLGSQVHCTLCEWPAMLVQTRTGLERGPKHTWFQKLPRWVEVQAYFRDIAGPTPDHCSKVRIIIKWVVIFLLVAGLPSIVKKCNIYEIQ